MFEEHPGNVLFTLIEQIDKLAMFTSFDVRCRIVPMPTGATGRFYEVVAEAGNDTPSVLFFSDDEKTAHNFRDLAEIGSVYFRNLSRH